MSPVLCGGHHPSFLVEKNLKIEVECLKNLHGNVHPSQVNKISPSGHGSRSAFPAQIGPYAISITEAVAFNRIARCCTLRGRGAAGSEHAGVASLQLANCPIT